jgi:hypothetical protein
MNPWKQALKEGAIAGSAASALSAAALVAAGRIENKDAAAPVNAVSHWLWGRPALRQNGPSLRFTLPGYLVHHLAAMFWGTLLARAWNGRPQASQPVPAVAGAAAATAVACFVDYQLTPERLTPGFEHRLSSKAMLAVYTCFGVGLAIATIASARSR